MSSGGRQLAEMMINDEMYDRQCLCIFRRALWLCSGWACASATRLAAALRVSDGNALKLMRLLHSHAVVDQPGQDAE